MSFRPKDDGVAATPKHSLQDVLAIGMQLASIQGTTCSSQTSRSVESKLFGDIVGARTPQAKFMKSRLEEKKTEKKSQKLQENGILDPLPTTESSSKTYKADPLAGVQLSEEDAVRVVYDASEFVEFMMPCPFNGDTAGLVMWVAANRVFETLGILSPDFALQFYEAANTHLFYITLIDNIEEDEPMDIGVKFPELKRGEQFVSELESLSSLAESLKESVGSNIENMKKYMEDVKQALARTRGLLEQQGFTEAARYAGTSASTESIRLGKKAASAGLKTIWSAIKTVGPSDIINICAQMLMNWIGTEDGQQTVDTFANKLDSEQLQLFNEMNKNHNAFLNFVKDWKVVDGVNAWNRLGVFKVPGFDQPNGLPAESIEQVSNNKLLQTSQFLTSTWHYLAPSRYYSGMRPALDTGDGPVLSKEYNDVAIQFRLVKSMPAVAAGAASTGGVSVATELGVVLLNVLMRAIGGLATLSKDRVQTWSIRNGSKERKRRIDVLSASINKLDAFLSKLGEQNNGQIVARRKTVTQYRNGDFKTLQRHKRKANREWKEGSNAIKASLKSYKKVFDKWFDNTWLRYVATELVRGGAVAFRFASNGSSELSKYLALGQGVSESASFALWRLNVRTHIHKINMAISKTDRIFNIMNADVRAVRFYAVMRPDTWTLQDDWDPQAEDSEDDEALSEEEDDYDDYEAEDVD